MKLGIQGGYAGRVLNLDIKKIQFAESLGFDSIWTAESYGADAVTPAAFILAHTKKIRVGTAIMQMSARTPAMTAMTAMTLNQLSNGRFLAGIGASGPQVVEGWHGVPFGRPITRMREYISIMRNIMARQAPLEFAGREYQLPLTGPGSTGLGKPLKIALEADRIPIYVASITPGGIEAAAELADGIFPIWMDPEGEDVHQDSIKRGLAAAGRSPADFDTAPFVTCVPGRDLAACRKPVKGAMARFIGGMGARDKNFYTDYAKALGYEEAAVKIQDLFLAGKRDEAVAAVPDELVDKVALTGPPERIRERLSVWKKAAGRGRLSSMLISGGPEAWELIAGELL